jgi:hypothetical protein
MPTVGGSSAICGGDIVFAERTSRRKKGSRTEQVLYSDF